MACEQEGSAWVGAVLLSFEPDYSDYKGQRQALRTTLFELR